MIYNYIATSNAVSSLKKLLNTRIRMQQEEEELKKKYTGDYLQQALRRLKEEEEADAAQVQKALHEFKVFFADLEKKAKNNLELHPESADALRILSLGFPLDAEELNDLSDKHEHDFLVQRAIVQHGKQHNVRGSLHAQKRIEWYQNRRNQISGTYNRMLSVFRMFAQSSGQGNFPLSSLENREKNGDFFNDEKVIKEAVKGVMPTMEFEKPNDYVKKTVERLLEETREAEEKEAKEEEERKKKEELNGRIEKYKKEIGLDGYYDWGKWGI